jgi:hypothetical protein
MFKLPSLRFLLLVAPIFLIAFSGCNRKPIVAQVGTVKITKEDVELRTKVMRVFSPDQNEAMAKEQLIRSYTLAESLRNKGFKNIEGLVDEEAKRLTESSRTNPKLLEAKNVFGTDEKAFKNNFVLPLLSENLAYNEGYLKDVVFHQDQKNRAEAFLAETRKNPANIESLAKQSKLYFLKAVIDPTRGVQWEDEKISKSSRLPRGPALAQKWTTAALSSLQVGKVSPALIDEGTFWVVLKRMGPSKKIKGGQEIGIVPIFKRTFGSWVNENQAKVVINRFDTK